MEVGGLRLALGGRVERGMMPASVKAARKSMYKVKQTETMPKAKTAGWMGSATKYKNIAADAQIDSV